MPNTEEYLTEGLGLFIQGLGGKEYHSDVPDGWKNLFRWKISQNLTWIIGKEVFLRSMALYMGQQAAAQSSFDGKVGLTQVNAAFPIVQEYAFHANGDIATNLC